jgi:hypothetical protein
MTARLYRLTRDLKAGTPGNQFPRDLMAGELLYRCTAPYAASLAGDAGVMLTEDPDGGYPGYEVPRSAVEEAPAEAAPGAAAPAYDEMAHRVFHDRHCRCGHKKGVHSGRDADGRCVLRRCGCGQFEDAGTEPAGRHE